MACKRVRVVEMHKLLEPDAFFRIERPKIEPPGTGVIFRLPFDKYLLFLIVTVFISLVLHAIIAFTYLPTFPPLPVNATTDCAFLQGSWNADQSVLRFYAVPYALPPLPKPDEGTLDMLQEYLQIIEGKPSLRWRTTQALNGLESCILSHYDRCSFKRGRWICDLGKPRPIATCIQPTVRDNVNVINPQHLFRNERCLQVDIAIPTFKGYLKPVIVVIAGEQFLAEPLMSPDSPLPAYWPKDETVRHTDAVWVYLHYRLGLAGFFYNLTQPRFKDQDTQTLSHENYALHDQLEGLRWIKTHVRQFGGDPERITVFGIASGATSVLALLKMKNKHENLFHQAWLSSGAVHWYSERDKTPRTNFIDKVFSDIATKYIGTHCGTVKPGVIYTACSLKELHQKLHEIPIQVFNNLIADNFKAECLIDDLMDSRSGKNTSGLGWIYAETISGNVLPPKYWTEQDILDIFSLGTRVVFSSMAQELEEWPGMGNSWLNEAIDEQMERMAKLFYRYRHLKEIRTIQTLQNLLITAWKNDLSLQSMKRSPIRIQQELHLELLSILRYSCPQSWLIAKLLKSKGQFYKLLLDEPSGRSIPFAPGPDFMSKTDPKIKRRAFHSLDALILTGKLENLQQMETQTSASSGLYSFSVKLKNMFKDFVHGGNLDSACKADTKGRIPTLIKSNFVHRSLRMSG